MRRSLTCDCGWSCVGSPREVEGKLRIHGRRCEIMLALGNKVPKATFFGALINGWGAVKPQGSNKDPGTVRTITREVVKDSPRLDE